MSSCGDESRRGWAGAASGTRTPRLLAARPWALPCGTPPLSPFPQRGGRPPALYQVHGPRDSSDKSLGAVSLLIFVQGSQEWSHFCCC